MFKFLNRIKMFFGLIFILVGLLFLLKNLGLLTKSIWNIFWPSLIMVIGIMLAIKRKL